MNVPIAASDLTIFMMYGSFAISTTDVAYPESLLDIFSNIPLAFATAVLVPERETLPSTSLCGSLILRSPNIDNSSAVSLFATASMSITNFILCARACPVIFTAAIPIHLLPVRNAFLNLVR